MKPGATAALTLGVGYVLGRRHKLRAALMLGAAAATGRLTRPSAKKPGDGGGGRPLGMVGRLGEAGRSAAVSAFARSADRLGDRLNQTAESMRHSSGGKEQ